MSTNAINSLPTSSHQPRPLSPLRPQYRKRSAPSSPTRLTSCSPSTSCKPDTSQFKRPRILDVGADPAAHIPIEEYAQAFVMEYEDISEEVELRLQRVWAVRQRAEHGGGVAGKRKVDDEQREAEREEGAGAAKRAKRRHSTGDGDEVLWDARGEVQ